MNAEIQFRIQQQKLLFNRQHGKKDSKKSNVCTNDQQRSLSIICKGSEEHPFSETAPSVGTRQKPGEQNKSQFQCGWMKMALKEEQEPITAKGFKHCFLLTGREKIRKIRQCRLMFLLMLLTMQKEHLFLQ